MQSIVPEVCFKAVPEDNFMQFITEPQDGWDPPAVAQEHVFKSF